MSDCYADIANHLRSSAPPGFARATMHCFWFKGVIKGPAVAYRDASGAQIPSQWSIGVQRMLSRLFEAQSEAERKRHATPEGDLPNVFTLELQADGSHDEQWTYDPDAQAKEDARLRASLGEAELNRLQLPAKPLAAPVLPKAKSGGDEPLSIPELLGFIQEEISKDAPKGWQTLFVEGEVWDEGGTNNIKTVYYYTLPDDATRRLFTATNVYGPMNAVNALRQRMTYEGKPWRKLRLEYTAGSTRALVDTE